MLNQGEISVAVLLDYSYTTAKNANPDYIWVDPTEGSFSGYNMLNIVKGARTRNWPRLSSISISAMMCSWPKRWTAWTRRFARTLT